MTTLDRFPHALQSDISLSSQSFYPAATGESQTDKAYISPRKTGLKIIKRTLIDTKQFQGYLDLAADERQRLSVYRSLFAACVAYTELHAIREAIQSCTPLGNNRFKEQIERALGRSTGYANQGRPSMNEEYAIHLG